MLCSGTADLSSWYSLCVSAMSCLSVYRAACLSFAHLLTIARYAFLDCWYLISKKSVIDLNWYKLSLHGIMYCLHVAYFQKYADPVWCVLKVYCGCACQCVESVVSFSVQLCLNLFYLFGWNVYFRYWISSFRTNSHDCMLWWLILVQLLENKRPCE
jgi:hypothetical protein